ncbi:helix-turn-helix transcriptional regulator [Pyrococcus kukulkanii]|uniref:helix-turn-helix transcriptional regulator n=1 Tax=Pyrococcus kukulkanii TaxID=1609559 RepID=UPI003562D902
MKKLLALFVFSLLLPPVSAQLITLTVYPDGYVKVEYEITPSNYSTQVIVPILGEHYEDLVVEDENGNPLQFIVSNSSILIYPGNAKLVVASYYTPDLTSKKGVVWTLNVSLSSPFTVVLPKDSIIVDLSDIPLKIAENTIEMPPGDQSISYTLPHEEAKENRWVYLLLASVILAIVLGAHFMKGRGKSITREEFEKMLNGLDLTDEEKKALVYIFGRGGRCSQAEVREAIGIPKTTAWRMFKRLERKGLVRILKGKKENWVELKLGR